MNNKELNEMARKVSKIDINSFVTREYNVKLTPVGRKGNVRGLCPLHNETDASFTIRPFNVFNCFSSKCRKGGNIIKLVEYKEGVSREEAVLKLNKLLEDGKYTIKEQADNNNQLKFL